MTASSINLPFTGKLENDEFDGRFKTSRRQYSDSLIGYTRGKQLAGPVVMGALSVRWRLSDYNAKVHHVVLREQRNGCLRR